MLLYHPLEYYQISDGNFDTITNCKYSIPSYTDIGKLYAVMIVDCCEEDQEAEEMVKIFQSFISDDMSDLKTGLYYQNPDYLEWSYRAGYLWHKK